MSSDKRKKVNYTTAEDIEDMLTRAYFAERRRIRNSFTVLPAMSSDSDKLTRGDRIAEQGAGRPKKPMGMNIGELAGEGIKAIDDRDYTSARGALVRIKDKAEEQEADEERRARARKEVDF